jgi:hypothetical protein
MDKWGYADEVAQVWRAAGDHHDSWSHTVEQLAAVEGKGTWSRPFGWAYLDMMMVGGEGCETTGGPDGGPDPMRPTHCPGQTDEEYRSEGALYAMVSSPMMVGTDIRNMTKVMKEVLLNPALIAIQQDTTHTFQQGLSGGLPTWTRRLSGGKLAVAVLNNNSYDVEAAAVFPDLGWAESDARVSDIFKQKDLGVVHCQSTKKLKPHDTLLLILAPVTPTPSAHCPPPTPRPTPSPTPPPSPAVPTPAPPYLAQYDTHAASYCSDKDGGNKTLDAPSGYSLEKCAAACTADPKCECFDHDPGAGAGAGQEWNGHCRTVQRPAFDPEHSLKTSGVGLAAWTKKKMP